MKKNTHEGNYEYKKRLNNGEFGWNTGRFKKVSDLQFLKTIGTVN